jgi:hypothetical protein
MSTRNPFVLASIPPIRSWTDGYTVLRRYAGAACGWIQLDSDAPDRRWPRTTGLDVIMIASFIDDAFRRVASTSYLGIIRRWSSCKYDLERDALDALGDTYRGNRAFWSCLAAVVAHLAHEECPLPSQAAWITLLADIGPSQIDGASRNAAPATDDPPVWFASAGSLDKLYLAQRQYLANLRGFDRLAPEPDMAGGVMPVPRSTNADVMKLAAFWTKALAEEKAKHANGYDTVRARWSAVERDIDQHARGGDPDAVYPKNHALWRAISSVAIHVAASLAYGLSAADQWRASVGEDVKVVTAQAKAIASAIASGLRDIAADAAHGAGKVLNEGARGLLGGVTTPLLIGGGVVAAIWFLRGRGESDHEDQR